MKLKKEHGGFSIRFGSGAIEKLQSKVGAVQSDLQKWQEVMDFMTRRAEEGDAIAEAWVRDVTAEMQKSTTNIAKSMTLSKKMFTEKNRIAVNATIQRNFNLENHISATDWESRNFDISYV
mgnify:CR=1 FL=1